ncbi:hypothetical protein L1049_019708 [Liquidambar formosana]|uniref:RNA polymerase II subunit B1 CTD phosphatase RPAP2 homolog n=1 Tax=Liquidambar formosana TaxID=63359 RepID=A0AAP0X9D8_LIQFO
MVKDQPILVKDAVYKLQLSLLEGIRDENQLFAAGSLMSLSDYEDVVTERSIAKLCGYPLCSNPLPSEQPRKGRYRISLKEHKVYDLHETYKYCSSSCVVNSRAFAGGLREERCSVLNSEKIDEILRLFEDLSLESRDSLGNNGDLGFSELKIEEKAGTKAGEVSLEEWIGPSNAIEGYVPQRDRTSKPLHSKSREEGSKSNHSKPNTEKTLVFNEMDFMSAIIPGDEYCISKMSSDLKNTAANTKSEESKGKVIPKDMGQPFTILEKSSAPSQNDSERKLRESKRERSRIVTKDKLSIPEVSSSSYQNSSNVNATEKVAQLSDSMLKSSLKTSGAKKLTRSVTWADEQVDSVENRNLCEIREMEDMKEGSKRLGSMDVEDDDNVLRFASAEACAIALSQAAEAVSLGQSDITDAVSEAGITILPCPLDVDEGESVEDAEMLESEQTPINGQENLGCPILMYLTLRTLGMILHQRGSV